MLPEWIFTCFENIAWAIPELQARTTPPSATITEAQAQPQRVAEPSIGAGKGL